MFDVEMITIGADSLTIRGHFPLCGPFSPFFLLLFVSVLALGKDPFLWEFAPGSGESLPDFSHHQVEGMGMSYTQNPQDMLSVFSVGACDFLFCIKGDQVRSAFPIVKYESLKGQSPNLPLNPLQSVYPLNGGLKKYI